jgi:hypothetical protein
MSEQPTGELQASIMLFEDPVAPLPPEPEPDELERRDPNTPVPPPIGHAWYVTVRTRLGGYQMALHSHPKGTDISMIEQQSPWIRIRELWEIEQKTAWLRICESRLTFVIDRVLRLQYPGVWDGFDREPRATRRGTRTDRESRIYARLVEQLRDIAMEFETDDTMWTEITPLVPELEGHSQAAIEAARHLLQQPQSLDIIAKWVEEGFGAGGKDCYVGDPELVKIAFLIALTAKGPRPVNLILKGIEGSGKTALFNMLAVMYGEEYVYRIGGASPQALKYQLSRLQRLPEERRPKVLFIQELAGGESSIEQIKLMSADDAGNARIALVVTERNIDGNWEAREYELPNMAIWSTTTAFYTDPELSRRSLSLNVKEGMDQTKNVIESYLDRLTELEIFLRPAPLWRLAIIRAAIAEIEIGHVFTPLAKELSRWISLQHPRARGNTKEMVSIVQATTAWFGFSRYQLLVTEATIEKFLKDQDTEYEGNLVTLKPPQVIREQPQTNGEPNEPEIIEAPKKPKIFVTHPFEMMNFAQTFGEEFYYLTGGLDPREKDYLLKIEELVKMNTAISSKSIAQSCNASDRTARRIIEKLREYGFLISTGEKQGNLILYQLHRTIEGLGASNAKELYRQWMTDYTEWVTKIDSSANGISLIQPIWTIEDALWEHQLFDGQPQQKRKTSMFSDQLRPVPKEKETVRLDQFTGQSQDDEEEPPEPPEETTTPKKDIAPPEPSLEDQHRLLRGSMAILTISNIIDQYPEGAEPIQIEADALQIGYNKSGVTTPITPERVQECLKIMLEQGTHIKLPDGKLAKADAPVKPEKETNEEENHVEETTDDHAASG